MVINDTISTVERHGDLGDGRGFRIMASAKAFEILSSGIYKDSTAAVLRELGTNAADSHIMAGKPDLPFSVHLPNHLEPYFSVQDFGVGLTEKQVHTVYTTYFSSDKTTSNDVTGCLGLGSKSPFAKTDQFTVTSVTEGRKRVYACCLGEEGPSITRMYDELTDSPTGVEVKLSVARSEFGEWLQKARQVYRWFTPRPEVFGLGSFEEDEIILQDDGWEITSATRNHLIVVMGNVGYSVYAHEFPSEALTDVEEEIFGAGLVLRVPIGSVDIAASRETLKFTARTIATIKQRLTAAADAATQAAHETVESCETLWDARLTLKRLMTKSYVTKAMRSNPPTWRGRKVDTVIKTFETVERPEHPFDPNDPNSPLMAAKTETVPLVHARAWTRGYGRRHSASSSEVNTIEVGPNVHFFVNDLKKGWEGRIKQYVSAMAHLQDFTLYLFTPVQQWDADQKGYVERDVQRFFEREEIADRIKRTSELDPVIKYYAPRAKTASIVRVKPSWDRNESPWAEAEVDIDAGGVYVEITKREWSAGDIAKEADARVLLNTFEADSTMEAYTGISCYDVVGVRKTSIKKFQKSDRWQRLDVFLSRLVADKDLTNEARQVELYRRIPDEILAWNTQYGHMVLPADSLFSEFVRRASQHARTSQDRRVHGFMKVRQILGLPQVGYDDRELATLTDLYEKVLRQYPLFAILRDVSEPAARRNVLQYVSLIDASLQLVTAA